MTALDQEPIDSPTGWVANHIKRYVETNGAEGHIWQGVPALLLTTLGRRSGRPRRLALYYAGLALCTEDVVKLALAGPDDVQVPWAGSTPPLQPVIS